MHSVHIDLAKAVADAKLGPLRAAAFVGTVLRLLENGVPTSISLHGLVRQDLLPDPLPESLRHSIADELPHWVIANALKELDQFFSIFLDNIWHGVQAARLKNGEISNVFPWEEISGITSTSRKFKKVISAAKEFSGQLALDHGYILTLSEARNCLAHNLGIIDERRAPEGTFSLKWLRIKVFATGEGAFDIELNGMEEPWEAVTPAQLMAQVVENEKVFKIGERFSISERELQEICILYIMMIDRSILAVERFMRSSGIEISG